MLRKFFLYLLLIKDNYKKNNKGFSLIELVIVIAVLSILGGVAIPYFDSLRKKAMIEVLKTNLKVISKNCLIYEIQNNIEGASFIDLGYRNSTSSFSDNGGLDLGSPGYPYYFYSLAMGEPLSISDNCMSITARSKFFPKTRIGVLPHFHIYYNFGKKRFETLCVVDSESTFNGGTCDTTGYGNRTFGKVRMW